MDPTRTALGTWSGGRFMHFGEPLDDDRLIALFRPDERIRTVLTADVYGQGQADMLLGADFLRAHRVLVARSQRKMYFTYAGGTVFPSNPWKSCS